MTAQFALALCLFVPSAHGQPPAFEVVSIKSAAPGQKGMDLHRDPGGGMTATNVDLRTLVILSYHIQPFQLSGGPGWVSSDRWGVAAKAPAGSSRDKKWSMLQALLADRFQLVVRREIKEMPVFALTAAKSGFKLKESNKPPNEADGSVHSEGGNLAFQKVTMADLAQVLAGTVKNQVLDQTNIAGKFDFTLQRTPDNYRAAPDGGPPSNSKPSVDPNGPTIFTALQEQLGLKLEPSRGPVETVVIERAERPTGN
jgi:uncharacterized protein (TIGR03435 family)